MLSNYCISNSNGTTGIIFSLGIDSPVHNVVDEAKINFSNRIKIFQLDSPVF